MEDTVITRTLVMIFSYEKEGTKRQAKVKIPNPKADLNPDTVKSAMQMVVDTKLFKGAETWQVKGAQIQRLEVDPLAITVEM